MDRILRKTNQSPHGSWTITMGHQGIQTQTDKQSQSRQRDSKNHQDSD